MSLFVIFSNLIIHVFFAVLGYGNVLKWRWSTFRASFRIGGSTTKTLGMLFKTFMFLVLCSTSVRDLLKCSANQGCDLIVGCSIIHYLDPQALKKSFANFYMSQQVLVSLLPRLPPPSQSASPLSSSSLYFSFSFSFPFYSFLCRVSLTSQFLISVNNRFLFFFWSQCNITLSSKFYSVGASSLIILCISLCRKFNHMKQKHS